MLNKITLISIITFISLTQVTAQTESFTISWDLNTESDINTYQIFRSTSPGASSQIATVQHPGNTYIDDSIEKGIQYYFRLKASDFSMNLSEYSTEVSAAIPLISGLESQMNLEENASVILQLDEHVFDPDNADETILWTVSGNANVDVNIVNRIATLTTPANWDGQEQIVFKAEDTFGFSDEFTITVIVGDGSVLMPPVFSTIPEQQIDEDSQTEVDLADYVSDSDSDISELQFSVQSLSVMTLSIEGSILTIDPNSNWNGQETINVTVFDNDNNSDQISFTITINPVNDAPVLSQLPSQVIKQDTTVIIQLSPYITDVDNNISELSWDFSNDEIVELSFDDVNDALTISSIGSPPGFDDIVVTVSDPANASAKDTLTVRVTSNEVYPPQIQNLPDIAFDEDGTYQILLNNYVSDADDPVENLFWYTGTDENIYVHINPVTNVATVSARQDWFGQASLWFIVQDPDQNMANAQITIIVNPVNDRPEFEPLPSLNMSEQLSRQLNLMNFSKDVDDDVNTLSWTAATTQNVIIEISENGLATFSVSDAWLGQERVEIYVSDNSGSSDTSATVVYRQNQQLAPQISGLKNFTIIEDGQHVLDLANHISDPDNSLNELDINFSNNKSISVTIDASSNEMTIIPFANWFGTENIFFEVLDPDNNVAFDTMKVVVTPVNDQPALRNIGNLTLIENTISTIDLSEYIIEDDGLEDIIEISVLGGNNSFFGYYLDAINYQLTFFSPAGFFGRETYLLKIKDSQLIEASTVFTVNVLEKNIDGGISVNYFGSQTNLNMSWNTYKETKDYIEFGTTTQYGLYTEADDYYSNDHNHLLTGLAEFTSYHFRIVSESIDGNMTYSSDSVFTTGKSSGDNINVFPIPYQLSKDDDGYGISFTNLPANSKLNIYNLLGEPVFKKDELNTTYRWNVKNNVGKSLSSGLYMYVINNEKNKKISSGKVIIVR